MWGIGAGNKVTHGVVSGVNTLAVEKQGCLRMSGDSLQVKRQKASQAMSTAVLTGMRSQSSKIDITTAFYVVKKVGGEVIMKVMRL